MLTNTQKLETSINALRSCGIKEPVVKLMQDELNDIAKERGQTLAQMSLAWVLKDPSICTIIPGYTTFDQIETDVEVMYDIKLTPDEEAELEEGKKLTGLFCQGCGTCKGTCTNKLPVPDMMRAYMYAYGYPDMDKARGVLETRNVDSNPCEGCLTCTVRCAKEFPVRERIEKIIQREEGIIQALCKKV